MLTQCAHTLPSGQKCQAPARTGSSFCHHHRPRPHLDPHPRERQSEPLTLPALDDKCAILTAVTEIVHAAGERRITCSDARTLLMGLKFAARLMTELDAEVRSSSDESFLQPAQQPALTTSAPQLPAEPVPARVNMLTPGELDDFTQRLQQAASQRLREKVPVPAARSSAGIADRDRALVAAIAASTDTRAEWS